MKNIKEVPQVIKNRTASNPIPLVGIYPKELNLGSWEISTPVFAAALFIKLEMWKQSKCLSTGE